MIAHPPCTYLSVSGLHWNTRRPERAEQTEDALQFVQALLEVVPVRAVALENPIGCISTRIRRPDQIGCNFLRDRWRMGASGHRGGWRHPRRSRGRKSVAGLATSRQPPPTHVGSYRRQLIR